MNTETKYNQRIPELIAATAAILLQVQVTLFASPAYTGLRVSLADLFLPFIGVAIIISLFAKKTRWPEWRSHKTVLFLCLLLTVMTMSIIQSGINGIGNFKWALVNKYVGFLILSAYLMLGAWLKNNENTTQVIETFARTFVKFFILTLGFSALAFFLQPAIHATLWLDQYPWDGFMVNRNAFAVLSVFAILLIVTFSKPKEQNNTIPQPILRRITDAEVLLWFLLPMFFVYNASRAGWLACGIILLVQIAKTPKHFAKINLPILVLGIILAFTSTHVQKIRHVENNAQFTRLLNIGTEEDKMYGGDKKRLIALEDGLELYQKSNPLLGAGLGAYKDFQIEKRGKFIDVIDFTGLWLLVETGALGLLAFVAFFTHSAFVIGKAGFTNSTLPLTDEKRFHRALLAFLFAFAAMSCLHEILYTRFLWFTLGLALAKPYKNQLA